MDYQNTLPRYVDIPDIDDDDDDDDDDDLGDQANSGLQTLAEFVKASPPPVPTTLNFVWRMPSSSAPSSASASAKPAVPVLQMRSVQRTPEPQVPDAQPEDDKPYYARLQQNNGGE